VIATNRGVEHVISIIESNNIFLYSLIIQVGIKALDLDDFVFVVLSSLKKWWDRKFAFFFSFSMVVAKFTSMDPNDLSKRNTISTAKEESGLCVRV